MKFDVNGTPAFAYTGGRSPTDGQPWLVFVHGAGLDHTVWTLHARFFAHHGYNVLAIDLPGHGRSAGALLTEIPDMADWCVAALSAAGGAQAAFIGHSMGSLVCLDIAARHPESAWHAALLGLSVPMPVTGQLLGAAEANDHAAFDMVNIWGHDLSSQIGGNQAPGMWMTGGAVRLLERGGPGVLHNDLAACNRYDRGLERAAGALCPVHVILGQRDMMASPRAARTVIGALAHAEVTQLDGCGHMLMAERPNEVLDALADALAGARPRAAA